MERRNLNATENAARRRRVKRARTEAKKAAGDTEPKPAEAKGNDWIVTATLVVNVPGDDAASEAEAVDLAAIEVREASMQDFDYSVTTARTLEAAREERKRAFLEFVNNNRPDAHSAAPCDAEIVYDDNGDMKGIRFIGIKWSEKLGFDL